MKKQSAVEAALRGFSRVIVAFSGGVDSTLLAKLSRDVLGKTNALIVTADSASLAREDLADAKRLASQLDFDHLVVETAEVNQPEYQANTQARCYFCKQALFESLSQLAEARGITEILYGVLADDKLDERPGHQAALEYGVRSPLQAAGLTKPEIRELACVLGLPNWNKPQNACLSSRIPHGQPVTGDKLKTIEQAESVLRSQGFTQVRVRHLGGHARIEVAQPEVHRFNDTALCLMVSHAFHELGFSSIGVSRSGYQQGGANPKRLDEVLLSAIGKC